jgi:hypothetical protein
MIYHKLKTKPVNGRYQIPSLCRNIKEFEYYDESNKREIISTYIAECFNTEFNIRFSMQTNIQFEILQSNENKDYNVFIKYADCYFKNGIFYHAENENDRIVLHRYKTIYSIKSKL